MMDAGRAGEAGRGGNTEERRAARCRHAVAALRSAVRLAVPEAKAPHRVSPVLPCNRRFGPRVFRAQRVVSAARAELSENPRPLSPKHAYSKRSRSAAHGAAVALRARNTLAHCR